MNITIGHIIVYTIGCMTGIALVQLFKKWR